MTENITTLVRLQDFHTIQQVQQLAKLRHHALCLWRSRILFFFVLFLKSCHRGIRRWSQEPLIRSCAVTAQVLLRNPVLFSAHFLGVDFCYRAT